VNVNVHIIICNLIIIDFNEWMWMCIFGNLIVIYFKEWMAMCIFYIVGSLFHDNGFLWVFSFFIMNYENINALFKLLIMYPN